ncbi:hypothetical protein [Pedobacter rhodius]|uniref:DUF2393 domain-containing protein n=1 Tax=Pedobacter rhodius TaxID=3004098 RepID=A0ABT4KX29_9SPHI|nr:hypothetical protein [Pedobacter sp. SJ11]MCZ4223493.1 hypothetical protein [Pedobacter sp. SJ11]
MTSQQLLLTILGLFLAVCIPIFIYYRKKYFVGGFLTVELRFSNGIGEPMGVVKEFIDEDGYNVRDKSIVRYHLTWRYEMTVTNNSDQLVLFPKISYNVEVFPNITMGEIQELKPIASGESREVELVFFEVSDTLPDQRKRTSETPVDFTVLKLLLEYYNAHDAKFYTLYDNADKSNKSYKIRPEL